MSKAILTALVLMFCIVSADAQTAGYQPVDPMNQIAADVASVSRSVKTLSDRLKEFVDKWERSAA